MENEKELEKDKNSTLDKAAKEEKSEKKKDKISKDTLSGRTDTGETRTPVEIDPYLKEQLDAEGLDPENLEELTMTQRLRRASIMRRYHSKLERKREIALKRNASMQIIMNRARKAAIKKIKQKRIGKSRDISSLSPAEKQRLEDLIRKRKEMVLRLARKLAPGVRRMQLQRLQKEEEITELKKTSDYIMVKKETPSGKTIWAKEKTASISVSKQESVNDRKEEYNTENMNTENPCWKGYKAIGTKKKNNKTVPNCVPVENLNVEEVKPENAPLAITRTNIDRKTLDLVSRINKERRDRNKEMYRLQAYYKQVIDDNNWADPS